MNSNLNLSELQIEKVINTIKNNGFEGKINAVKMVLDFSGNGLKESKDFVDKLISVYNL